MSSKGRARLAEWLDSAAVKYPDNVLPNDTACAELLDRIVEADIGFGTRVGCIIFRHPVTGRAVRFKTRR